MLDEDGNAPAGIPLPRGPPFHRGRPGMLQLEPVIRDDTNLDPEKPARLDLVPTFAYQTPGCLFRGSWLRRWW
jgi:hypothetical protein